MYLAAMTKRLFHRGGAPKAAETGTCPEPLEGPGRGFKAVGATRRRTLVTAHQASPAGHSGALLPLVPLLPMVTLVSFVTDDGGIELDLKSAAESRFSANRSSSGLGLLTS